MSPGDGQRTKEQGFKNFPSVIQAICKAARLKANGSGPIGKLVQRINEAEDSCVDFLPEDTLPDAYIVPRDGAADGGTAAWDGITAVGWYKRCDDEGCDSSVSMGVMFDAKS